MFSLRAAFFVVLKTPNLRSHNPVRFAIGLALGVWAFPAIALAAIDDPRNAEPREGRGGNVVRVDAENAVLAEDPLPAYWVFPSSQVTIPLKLDAPAGSGGESVDYVTYLNPGLGTATFGPGESTDTIQRTYGGTEWENFYPGWRGEWAYFALTTSSSGLSIGNPRQLYFARVEPVSPGVRGEDCATCFLMNLFDVVFGLSPEAAIFSFFDPLCIVGAGNAPRPGGGFARGAGEEELGRTGLSAGRPLSSGGPISYGEVLRRYRNEILMSSAEGQFYANLYTQISPDLILAMVASPSLPIRIVSAMESWTSAFLSLADGQGAAAAVTQDMQDDLLSILQTFEEVGTPELASTLAFERKRLNLDQIAGLTIGEFQTQVETLGGPTSIAPMSWGRVKGLYR